MGAPAVILATLLASVQLSGCNRSAASQDIASPHAVGNAEHGAVLIQHLGCGGCHIIPDISNAKGVVGPPLTGLSRRVYIAGMLRNTPDNLELWIRNPQAVVPGNVMPAMGIDRQDARDIAAYLYTLK